MVVSSVCLRVKLLQPLQAGGEIEAADYRGKTALFHAVSNGHNSLTRFMLESGANPNVKERLHGYTPLIEAAIEDQQLIVEALLEFVSAGLFIFDLVW